MKKIALAAAITSLFSCRTANNQDSAVKDEGTSAEAGSDPTTIRGQDAASLFKTMASAGLVKDQSAVNVSSRYSATQIACAFTMSNGSRRCSLTQSGVAPKAIAGGTAQTVIDVLVRAGVPKLFQFEGGRYEVTDAYCLESSFDGLKTYECSFVPTAEQQ